MRLLAILLVAPTLGAWQLREVSIRSSKDGAGQKAMWRHPDGAQPVPLLVALHSWSGDYKQKDAEEYASRCAARNWALIFPDFRGPNRRPVAGGSPEAVADIVDAVDWARAHASIEPRRIYVAGGSGGGHMSLLMAARHPNLWAAVSAYVPITDLAVWHSESVRLETRYAANLEAIFDGPPDSAARRAAYRNRSPLFELARAHGVPIDIAAGIHDGHKGSVPVGHSLRAFNELASANGDPSKRFSDSEIDAIVRTAKIPADWPPPPPDPAFPKPVLHRRHAGSARVTLFDGGHEILFDSIFAWLERQPPR
jgi:dipeptidyl aminopeptidase/acylaminoacyl peptidase